MPFLFCRRPVALLLASLALVAPLPAHAGEITLDAIEGTFTATGELISFEDGLYVLKTNLGNMIIDANTVTCTGDACPQDGSASAPPAPQAEAAAAAPLQGRQAAAMPVHHEGIPEADVLFVGSDTLGDGLMPLLLAGYGAQHNALVEEYPGSNGDVTIELVGDEGYGDPVGVFRVVSTTSADAFPALLDKSAEFGMASRRIRRDEARALARDGAGSMIAPEQEHIVAVDSLVVIVNPANPVRSLTMENLAKIYRGEIANWAELGGPDLPIIALSRPEGSGTRITFEQNVFGTTDVPQQAEIADSNTDMAVRVSTEAGAIGFVGYAFVNDTQPLSLVSACGIETAPTAFSAKTEEYPMERRLYLYTRQDNRTETGQAFLDYALSSAADGVIEKSGYISLGVERISQEMARNRAQEVMENTANVFELHLIREMLLEMYQWDRLSSTFRFASGSNNLDRRSRLELDRLIEYLARQPEGTAVAVVGFTDSDGVFNANRKLSERRAAQVLVAIQDRAEGRLDHIEFETMGFGELSPADCNTTSEGKRINRRVEIWIQ